jgi:hypothetical protein
MRRVAHPGTRGGRAAALCAAWMLTGCAGPRHPAPASVDPAAIAADTALFAAVVRAIPALPKVPVRVDPRVLRGRQELYRPEARPAGDLSITRAELDRLVPRDVFFPDSTALVPVDARMLRLRSAVLSARGIAETDALRDARCPGAGVEPGRDRSACPREGQFTSAILAEPRPGGAYWPGVVDEREAGRGRGEWTVRVTERTMTPAGTSTGAADYVLVRDRETRRWRFVKRVLLLVLD